MADQDLDTFIADTEPKVIKNTEDAYNPPNLADDEDLVKECLAYVDTQYQKFKSDRSSELEEIWKMADASLKANQNEAQHEIERGRTDRNSDDNMTKTKTQKVGSTILWRQVRALAGMFIDVLTSKKDPYKIKSRWNPAVWGSGEQADEMADQHQALARWTRQQSSFGSKSIAFAHEIFTYGNVPMYSHWKKETAEVLDRWPVGKSGKTVLERRRVLKENRPDWGTISNWNFYADQNIPTIQEQNCIVVKSETGITELRDAARRGLYMNVDELNTTLLYRGGDDVRTESEEDNSTYDSNTDKTRKGKFLEFQAMALLPIDETKSKGKRWDEEKNELKKYWVTIISDQEPTNGLVVRIQRNKDPDDEYPYKMVRNFPIDNDKLYGPCLAQILRGNINEQTTTKQQGLDRRTVNNNRPLKVKKGEVWVTNAGVETENFTFGPDVIYECNDPSKDISEFELSPVSDNANILAFLENDSNETAGTTQTVLGAPLGGRTSASEAENVNNAAARPHLMIFRYILDQWLSWQVKKEIRLWHIYGKEDQIIRISDQQVQTQINPTELYGDFDIEITLVQDFEQNIMDRQNLTFAAQNLLPILNPVLNLRNVAKRVFDDVLHWESDDLIKPDNSEATEVKARRMIEGMKANEAEIPQVNANDDLDVMMHELTGELISYNGVESEVPWLPRLKKAIQQTKFLQDSAPSILPQGTPAQPSGNETTGEVVGNEIAAQRGAVAGGGQV